MKWSLVKAGWLGAIFGIAALWMQGELTRPDVAGDPLNLAAAVLGGAAGGILLFGTAAPISNLFVR